MRISHAILAASTLAWSPIMAQTVVSERSGQAVRDALLAAENAAREANEAARRATDAAKLADERLAEARRLMALTPISEEVKMPEAPATEAPVAAGTCPTYDFATLAYFQSVEECEEPIWRKVDVPRARLRSATGVGTTVAVAAGSSAGTVQLENVTSSRYLLNEGREQKVSRLTISLGVRANLSKDDKNLATIATFGQLDRLASNLTGVVQIGRDYSAMEPFRSAQARAKEMLEKVSAQCRAAGASGCEGKALLEWIFKSKDRNFVNPDAVKLYNAVFWGPPKTDPAPRWGWSLRGEISRPTFDYFPFGLTQIPDPFKPGKTKTVIDPATFPNDFATRIIENDARINFVVAGRAFVHISKGKAERHIGDGSWIDYYLGTTLVGSVAYKREDQIEKRFRDIRICPPPPAGQSFVTDQACTTVNIAMPKRTESVVLGAELRQGFEPFWIIPHTMFAPRYTYDTDTGQNGFSIPVYVGLDDKGIFKTGLRVAGQWGGKNADGSEKKSEFIAGIVLNANLNLDGTTGID